MATTIDRRGLTLTADNADAVGHLDQAITCFLGHRADMAAYIERALEADPDFFLAHCMDGLSKLLLGRSELKMEAMKSRERAQQSFRDRGGTQRERLVYEALSIWLDGEMEQAATILERSLAAYPLDAMTFKLAHAIRLMLGDAHGMRLAAEMVVPAWSEDMPDHAYILGCHAFALEETGEFEAAERQGRRAITLEPADAWACHAVAHVMQMRDRPREGIAWLEECANLTGGCKGFSSHLAYDRSLFYLALGEMDMVLDLYDREIRATRSDDYRDVANAASLLWRLESEGVRVGERWEELANLSRKRLYDHALVFADLHYTLCLAGAGRWEALFEMLAAVDRECGEGWGTQLRVRQRVGLAAAKAIVAVSFGDHGRAVDLLMPRREDLRQVGGSRVQRDLFNHLLIDAAISAGRYGAARTLLAERAAARPSDGWSRNRADRLPGGRLFSSSDVATRRLPRPNFARCHDEL